MTYWRLPYHFIWATFERQQSITPEREKMIYGVLYRKAEALGVKIHAAGNVEDHIHIVASIPPNWLLQTASVISKEPARTRLIECRRAMVNSSGRKAMVH